jgi:hypothetical protein
MLCICDLTISGSRSLIDASRLFGHARDGYALQPFAELRARADFFQTW